MTEADIPAGLALCRAAGWNQLERDWRLILAVAPETTIVAELDGVAAGTAALLDFGSGFAWVSMVLVDPAYRGRGVGTALFEHALEIARGIPCVRLDASPEGRKIYRKYGFTDDFEITRFEGHAAATTVQPDGQADFEKISALDRQAFGADRTEILRASFTHAAAQEGDAFAVTRPGSLADHIGPIVAPDFGGARKMLDQALADSAGKPVFLDVPQHALPIVPTDFLPRRQLIRMSRGINPSPGMPERQFAILGPEFG